MAIRKKPLAKRKRACTVRDNTFIGVQYDGDATRALLELACGMRTLAEVFRCSKVDINALLKIEPEE